MHIRSPLAAVALAAAAAALIPAGARAADTVVASVARGTPVAADAGHVVYSAWDGRQFRLTDLTAGVATALSTPGQSVPFAADLGPGPDGHELAVYPRCAHAEAGTGCDLYATDLVRGIEHKLTTADSPTADEVSGAVWRDRLVFTRVYGRGSARHGIVYQRSLTKPGASKRVSARLARSLDLRGTRIPYVHPLEWSNEPWLLSLDGHAQRLKRVPGSGAAVDFDDTLGPTAYGASTYWLLAVSGDDEYSEIHRFNRTTDRDERVTTRIPATATGFSYDGAAAAAYSAIPAAGGACVDGHDCPVAIHRTDGLSWEPAPAITLK
jgi:hypothetical protein